MSKLEQNVNLPPKRPLVSVIMPAFNAEEYLREAIESILSQTFRNFEFIIVDDGSTDNTKKVLKKYQSKDKRIRVITNSRQEGLAIASNTGVAAGRGKYIARMDADDWAYPNRLKQQVEYLDKHKDVAILGGVIEVCDAQLNVKNERHYYLNDIDIRRKLFRYSPFSHPSIMMRAKLLRAAGGYDPYHIAASDYDMYFRIGRYGKFAALPHKLLKHRVHHHSISQVHARKQELLTLFIRLKAVLLYGYKMNFADKLYFILQVISLILIPSKLKFWLFNKIRSFKVPGWSPGRR